MQALVVLNNAKYTPERWQGTLLTWAAAITVSSFNVFCAKHLPLAEGIFCSVHFFAFVPVIACLWIMTPSRQTAHDVFLRFSDNGAGWPNMGATVLAGQVSSMFVVLGQDSVAHMAEEVGNAGTVVPQAMLVSFLLNLPFTFILLITWASRYSRPQATANKVQVCILHRRYHRGFRKRDWLPIHLRLPECDQQYRRNDSLRKHCLHFAGNDHN